MRRHLASQHAIGQPILDRANHDGAILGDRASPNGASGAAKPNEGNTSCGFAIAAQWGQNGLTQRVQNRPVSF